jgi:hypothetical protein
MVCDTDYCRMKMNMVKILFMMKRLGQYEASWNKLLQYYWAYLWCLMLRSLHLFFILPALFCWQQFLLNTVQLAVAVIGKENGIVSETEGMWPNKDGKYRSLLTPCNADVVRFTPVNLDCPLTRWNFSTTLPCYSYVLSILWLSLIAGFGISRDAFLWTCTPKTRHLHPTCSLWSTST